ncbi:DEAD/DEAH box helicase [Candidatus Woesebacteria bacterium]|nr:DEAD/DEAH box helicase [Candidatus Woesebacteria bacterium]
MSQSFRTRSSSSQRSFGGSRGGRHSAPRRPSGQYIAPSRYVQAAQTTEPEAEYQPKHTFSDFVFDDRLLQLITTRGYQSPTPIQDQAIPALLEGKDVIGIANTGTGKTAAFLLPLINKVLLDSKQGVLILAPTRELAVQIQKEFRLFTEGLPISSCLCIGGQNLDRQVQRLRRNPHFVIGTPGRIKDLIQRRAIDTQQFTNVVLDEVDRMLDIGFRKEIMLLISQLPRERQSALFSATMNSQADGVARTFLQNPERFQIKTASVQHQIDQDVIKLQPGQNKVEVLHELLLQAEFKKVMVFGRTKHGINKLEKILSAKGVRVTSIHGNKNQNARQRSLEDFKFGKVQALLATDVASRGIDIYDVTHVINYDEPQSYDDYIHRIGRTGRAGKGGKALTFVS